MRSQRNRLVIPGNTPGGEELLLPGVLSMSSAVLVQALVRWGGRLALSALVIALAVAALHLRRPVTRLVFRWSRVPAERASNLEPIYLSLSKWLVWASSLLAVMSLLGADLAQVVTGAGIIGLALGLGAQSVVRDMIAGFFIMVENQFRPGDYVQINGEVEGVVESVDLRITRLRGWDGALVCLGNQAIARVKNYNRDGMRVIIEASVPFSVDHARVREVIEALCAEMAKTHREDFLTDPYGRLIEPPFLYGITDISSARGVGATYCVMALTKVDSYWYIAREIRRLLLERMGQEGIHLSYPQRIYHQP